MTLIVKNSFLYRKDNFEPFLGLFKDTYCDVGQYLRVETQWVKGPSGQSAKSDPLRRLGPIYFPPMRLSPSRRYFMFGFTDAMQLAGQGHSIMVDYPGKAIYRCNNGLSIVDAVPIPLRSNLVQKYKCNLKGGMMPIITINRGSYSRGKAVAEKLASKLGYECISRDVLLDASDEFNIPEIKLIRALHDAPSILERFTHGKDRYVSYIYSALLQYARKDNIVYHGLAGQFLLRDISHVCKARIIADTEDRVKEEMRRENISADKALYILKKDDEERRKWALQMYGMDPCDSKLYDIVLNIHKLTVDDAVEILFSAVQKPAFQATAASRQQVEDLALSAKVKATISIFAPKSQIRSDNGKIFIGYIDSISESERDRIRTVAAQVEGVREVAFNLNVPKEQHDHINPFHNIG